MCKFCDANSKGEILSSKPIRTFEWQKTAGYKPPENKIDFLEMFILKNKDDKKAGLMIDNGYGYRYIDINYCMFCRKEAGRVNEEEIRKRIEILEIRKNGYLEVGNTNQVRKIENEIHKWEDLLERINGSLEKKVEKLEYFIKSKDLWESYLNF